MFLSQVKRCGVIWNRPISLLGEPQLRVAPTNWRRFFSSNPEVEEAVEEDEDVPSRTHWRNEISIPLDVQKFVRERCKKYNHNQRENAWKEYLSQSRSRSAQKGFFDWGNESIITPSSMKPLVYDELTCTSYLEYRLHKNYSICTRVFNDVIPALPSTCQPLRMLDIGCGCGSASLAALEHFPSINHVSLVDGSEYMTDMASSLLSL
ncbi:hypothetical protein WA577_005080, partial [Blastocystis sp. JDR]